jgi:hypothetical protein
MDNHDKQVLTKIYDHAGSVLEYCKDCKDFSEFESNKMLVEACVFNLMQIGELAKSMLSDDTKSRISSIPWKQLYGMRNRIVHGYSGVDLSIVWETVHDDIPMLCKELEKYIREV